jgi:hypothetical protein
MGASGLTFVSEKLQESFYNAAAGVQNKLDDVKSFVVPKNDSSATTETKTVQLEPQLENELGDGWFLTAAVFPPRPPPENRVHMQKPSSVRQEKKQEQELYTQPGASQEDGPETAPPEVQVEKNLHGDNWFLQPAKDEGPTISKARRPKRLKSKKRLSAKSKQGELAKQSKNELSQKGADGGDGWIVVGDKTTRNKVTSPTVVSEPKILAVPASNVVIVGGEKPSSVEDVPKSPSFVSDNLFDVLASEDESVVNTTKESEKPTRLDSSAKNTTTAANVQDKEAIAQNGQRAGQVIST